MMMKSHNCWLLVSCALFLVLAPDDASGRSPDHSREIRPILAEYCFACHGADAEGRQAELRLDTAEGAHEWAIVPGSPDDSEVIARVFSDDPELVMPPPSTHNPLDEQQKELLRKWIEAGAEYSEHWAFVPPELPEPPEVANQQWPKNEIDAFVLAGLEGQGLAPAQESNAYALCRRVSLDVTGLPPSTEVMERFVESYQSNPDEALSDLIDQLMESPAWGEHRGRYWLDAARYGDTHGMHYDNYREMWLYRDWVIRAFNANQPFDQFTLEQLAGDLLPDPTEEQLIATGFQRCNMTTNEGGTIPEENQAVYAADRVQTFSWIYLGLTTNCAQCHDHKFDPISTKDYYSLAAFFRNTTEAALDLNHKAGAGATLVVPSKEDRERWKALPGEIGAASASIKERRQTSEGDFQAWLEEITPEKIATLVPSDQLVFHAPLDHLEGPTISAVAGGSSLLSVPTKHELKWVANGKLGPAPLLDETYVFFKDVGDFQLDQPFSGGLWIRASAKHQNGRLLSRMQSGGKRHGWELATENNRFVVRFLDDRTSSELKVVTKQWTVRSGNWQHVFVTYDGSRKNTGVRIYVDGTLQETATWKNVLKPETSIRNEAPLQIGGKVLPEPIKDTALQGVRIYDRHLNNDEVKDLFESVAVRQLLAVDRSSWSDKQHQQVLDSYLRTNDEPYQQMVSEHRKLAREQKEIRKRSPLTHIQKERDQPAMAHVLKRGAYDALGEEVEAAPPAILHDMPQDAPRNRLGLAQWVVDAENPLTARVTVNRFWQEIFGLGLVATPEDFGIVGSPPTNQALLDWLAIDFQTNGWDVKRLFKQILMSATYRQAAITTPEKLEKDRDNSFFSRGPRFRMDAEMVRDSALHASGLLSTKMFGPAVRPYQPGGIWDIVGLPGGNTRDYKRGSGEDLYRRSIYTFWKRMAPPPNMDAFNAPSREVCTVRRERTNTPLQALVTLNDPQFVEAARMLAAGALSRDQGDIAGTLQQIALAVLSRPLSEQESTILLASQNRYAEHYQNHPEAAKALVEVGEAKLPSDIDPAQIASWTMVCSQVMNLDEALTK